MPSIWDMDYGTVRKGTGRLSGREVPRETPSLWDYINAVSMTPVPGVSDVAAGLLAAKDFREGNYGSGALNAAGVLPFVPALGGIFKGVKGATKAEKQALLKAQKMAKEGASRDEIWNATLWYKGKDGKWRTEIDDSAAKFNLSDAGENPLTHGYGGQDLGPAYGEKYGLIVHPELTRSYDPLETAPRTNVRDSMTLLNTDRGSFDPRTKTLTVFAPASVHQGKSTTLHELQHAIQQREGMARGGSPEAMSLLDIAPPGLVDSIKRSHAYRLQVAQGRNANDALEGMLAPYMSSMGNAAEAKMEAYKRLLGEVDARNVQARMDMTLDQRREFPPWSTWDVPEEQQIVRFGDGTAMMVAPKKLEQGLAGEPGYVYHATNADRLREILESGKLNTHKPWDFTEQDFWPDGSTAKRAYFGKGPENLWQFAPPEGQPVVIRAKESAAKFKRESTGDIFTEKPIGAKNLEFLGDDGAWHPLVDLNK